MAVIGTKCDLAVKENTVIDDHNLQRHDNSMPAHCPKHYGSLKIVTNGLYECEAAVSCEVGQADVQHSPLLLGQISV